ncbi:Fe(3+)-hydroxamate ABC transporter permease FhuB [Agrobacterium tumefaciens]|uniref:Fe(3+)-hydroxamate ABC transporter permease FhuB n=1 Tax=Agrobacterium tumefaciens TaxID=358 RepID=UPI002243390D|nr:Fe(3+)-hydroxamate ABC transporter permease FhuB [Agrobacterium tumefaciens]MCW8057241.1 Fe(3+)-hydroxamate ABC transporter permease FhuB [Agrobacterium tumefaciens]
MVEMALPARVRTTQRTPLLAVVAAAAVALVLTLFRIEHWIELRHLSWVLIAPDPDNIREMIVHYSLLPRMLVSILCGATLALAGVVFQQVLRNPIAEPTTLGVSAGASLALTVATLWAPGLLAFGRETVALVGAAIAILFVFGVSWGRALSPLSLILAGLVVNFLSGSIVAAVTLFYREYLESLLIWGTGSLQQNDWSAVSFLLPRLALAWVAAAFLVRPMTLLGLEEEGARNLGLSLKHVRLIGLALAVALSAFVVSAVGMIGFVGLACPAIARLMGARRFRDQLVWAPLLGGSLLWLTDQAVQWFAAGDRELIPTGIAASLLGAPMLLWLLPRLSGATMPPASHASDAVTRIGRPWVAIGGGIVLLSVLAWAALHMGRGFDGWHWSSGGELASIIDLRLPRLIGSLAGGVMLAVAGTLMQRLTGNPMASPEVLGITSGAMLGVILAMLVSGVMPNRAGQVLAGGGGAFAVLAIMLLVSRKATFSPERMLLAGIALGTVVSTMMAVLMASGDPRMGILLTWMAGSTYRLDTFSAGLTVVIAIASLAVVPFAQRWLDILPLGETMPRAVGLGLAWSRLLLLLIIAIITAAATLVIGPMTFIGLMAPHIARMLGFQRAMPQLLAAAVLGALIMVAADWLGRTILFPDQLPAGLVASLLGGPFLLWRLCRGR